MVLGSENSKRLIILVNQGSTSRCLLDPSKNKRSMIFERWRYRNEGSVRGWKNTRLLQQHSFRTKSLHFINPQHHLSSSHNHMNILASQSTSSHPASTQLPHLEHIHHNSSKPNPLNEEPSQNSPPVSVPSWRTSPHSDD